MEWANGQQAKEKQDIAHVHKALGAVSERSTDTFQAELDGVSEDRVNYMETLHFLAMHRTSLQAISEHFEFMRKKGIKIAEEHNNRHQIRKALGTLWGTISDEVLDAPHVPPGTHDKSQAVRCDMRGSGCAKCNNGSDKLGSGG